MNRGAISREDIKHILKWNMYYKQHGDAVTWGVDKVDRHVEDFLRRYPPRSWDKILDVGCGYGKNAPVFLSRSMSYWGVDISMTAIASARRRHPWGTFLAQDILCADGLPGSFDYIVDAGCIHVNPPDTTTSFLTTYASLLRSGGCLFVRIFRREQDSGNPSFFIDWLLPVWWYTRAGFISCIDQDKFIVEDVLLDTEYYEEDEIFYFYLRKK